jgi:hypothetical protein
MIVHRIARFCLFFCFGVALLPATALSHGGVVEEDDLCVIKVNFLRAHFKVYQPESSGLKQFCEDLPVASPSVFVMEYQHDSLSEMSVDFRIIRDVMGKGRFARLEDVEQIDDLDAATVYYQAPIIEPDVYSISHDFKEEGEFVGIVSARHAETGKLYTAVFPFEVGFTGLGYWPFMIGLLVLIQLQYLFMSGRLKRWFGSDRAVPIVIVFGLMLAAPDAFADDLTVTYTTTGGDPEINRIHSWILHIEDESGDVVEGAEIEVEGGMPNHDHGLPTEPRITEDLGDGNYRLEGMRFHMRGYWEVVIQITTNTGTSTVTLPLQL